MKSFNFSEQLLLWFDLHGRKDLPWQLNATPYHVWLSEIMLQQTQVTTVIGYYQNFTSRFPDLASLEAAEQDEVLVYWSGLGYYARARNLHKAANIIVEQHDGQLPNNLDDLIALPGIGRSTAGAIMSLAYHQKYPILDGNVKRVLSRFYAVDEWPGKKDVENVLWQRAEQLLPDKRIANYIQAQMDLGATLCTRSRPNCVACPLKSDCKAYSSGSPTDFPVAKPQKKKSPQRSTSWLVLLNEFGEVFLQQRPNTGIWGGLWCFPEFTEENEIESLCQQFQVKARQIQSKTSFNHIFTHFKLHISPFVIHCHSHGIADNDQGKWYKIQNTSELGLPAPVKTFLNSIT